MRSSFPADAPAIREPLHAPVAHVTRGGVVEGIHYGSVVVLGDDGEVGFRIGDIEAACYPRSALKPVQAVAMVRAGLLLDGDLLALAMGSHSGEDRHLAGTRRILELAGVTEDDLRNVPDLPYGQAARDAWVREGRPPSRLAQNCSGKHAAMLYLCTLKGWPPKTYLDPAHPLQKAIAEVVEELTGQRIANVTVDGCGSPLFSVSLHGLARAAARIAAAPPGTAERRVADALRGHPEMASGAGRDGAGLMRAVPGLLAKDGFEGVQIAALPDGRAVAVKIADGADRARVPVAAAALARAGVDPRLLADFAGEPMTGGGRPVGGIRPVAALDPHTVFTPARPEPRHDPAHPAQEEDPHAMTAATRSEHDLLGDRDVPADAYWGVHTLRATENFPITGTPISAHPHLIDALAAVKEAAALANEELGLLEPEKAAAIVAACREIRGGKLHDQFVVDVIQGGAGTSTNMNANEVVANRALELLGHARGEYRHLHPNEDVNLGQSTNDVYPTAVRIATVYAVRGLLEAMAVLQHAFARKSVEFRDVLKMGRTQLQDAVPMTLGQEFSAFAVMLDEDRSRLAEAVELIHEINLGATAIGTGLNAPTGYAESARRHLADITGLPLVTAANLVEATQDCGAFVQMSGVLKRIAVKLSKTCNDLRLLSSGPRAGLGEINLPAVQAGSSIMPGKVNPVIPEVVNQVAFEVIGNDVAVTMAAEAGQLQLNAFEPIILHSLSKSVTHLSAACLTLAERCVVGITANTETLRATVENSIGLVTALNPHIGYTAATDIAKEALASGRGVAELVLEKGLLPARTLSALLRPEVIAGTGAALA